MLTFFKVSLTILLMLIMQASEVVRAASGTLLLDHGADHLMVFFLLSFEEGVAEGTFHHMLLLECLCPMFLLKLALFLMGR